MADYTIEIDGIPWRVRNAKGTREEAQAYYQEQWDAMDPEIKKLKKQARIEELNDLGVQLGSPSPRGSTLESFGVGIGRTTKEYWNGARQLYAQAIGDEEGAREIAREEAEEQRLFDMMDKEGTGAEDLGQLAPDLVAFLIPAAAGARGAKLIASESGLGALLGGVRGTTNTIDERQMNAIVGGVSAGAGAALFPALGAVLRQGRRLTTGSRAMFQGLVNKLTSEAGGALANPATQKLGSAAMRKLQRVLDGIPGQEIKIRHGNAAYAAAKNALGDATVPGGFDLNIALSKLNRISSADLNAALSKPAAKALKDYKKALTILRDMNINPTPQQADLIADTMMNGGSKELSTLLSKLTDDSVKEAGKRTLWQRISALTARAEPAGAAVGAGVGATAGAEPTEAYLRGLR